MPFLDPTTAPPLPRAPEGVTSPAPVTPSLGETFAAGFGQDNPTINFYRRMHDEQFPVEPDHNPLDMIRGTDYETQHLDNFVASRSTAETRAIMRRIDNEDADRKTLAASGVAGFVAQAAAGIVDPTILLPGGVLAKSVKGGYSVSRSALSVGLAAGAQTAVQEAALHGLQETRTAGESAISIGSATLLGAILGGGAAGLLSRGEQRTLQASLSRDRLATDAHAGVDVFNAPPEVGFDVFHGSPHEFERFDASKIGTGEGAQSYGHGLYVAERPAVARSYQLMGDATVGGRPFDVNNPVHKAVSLVDEFGSRDAAIKETKSRIQHDPGSFYEDVLRRLESDRPLPAMETSGHMYKVRVHADREHFLDYDKPFSKQSPFVRDALKRAGYRGPDNRPGGQIARDMGLTETHYDPKLGSQKLHEAGIPGIKYLDQGSRPIPRVDVPIPPDVMAALKGTGYLGFDRAGEALRSIREEIAAGRDWKKTWDMERPEDQAAAALIDRQARLPAILEPEHTTSNFVVFDDNLLSILEKNGQQTTVRPFTSAPTGASSAGAAATDTRQLEMFGSIPGTANLSVTRRTMAAQATDARRVMADLAETPYRFKENEAGVATTQGPAVDRLARMEINGTRVAIGDELQRQYSTYRFGQPDKMLPGLRDQFSRLAGGADDGKMSYHDFKQEVGLAMQSGDTHAIPEVASAAQFVRGKLEPWGLRAEAAVEGFKMLTPKAGESYFPHSWNKEKVKARRPEFTNRLTDLYKGDQETKRATQGRLAGLQEELSKARTAVEKAKDPDALAAATLRHDDLRAKIEAEIGAWDGKSAAEAKAALKAREKYATDTGRAEGDGKPRLASADKAIDDTVEKIVKSDRDLSDAELRARAQQTVDRILGSPDGRLPYDMHMGGPRIGPQSGPPPRGSLAGRQLDVTNAWARDWIENDVEHVVAMHLRTVVPDVLLAERFGDVEMTNSFRKINEAYANLIDASKGEAARVKLGKERDAVIRDVAAVRDRVRGVYGWSPELANMARIANGAKAVNNITSMGVAAVSSLPDFAGAMFRWGVTGAIRDGWAPFFRGLSSSSEEWGKFKSQMRAIGIGVETAINARQHSLDDVSDVYRPQSRIERTLQAASDKFFIANLLAPLTDTQKLIAAHASVSEIIRAARAASEGKATKRQLGNLAESGIDQNMAGRIWQQFQTGGEVRDGVHLPNTADWRDKAAADALNGAVAREVDIAVVTPGQDKPLWMSKPVISLLGQFKSFTAAATERIIIANLQRRDAAALSGLIFSLGLGMLSYKINAFFGGQKTSDRANDWFREGVSRAGLLGWLEEGNALASKMTRGSVDIYRMAGSDKPLSRYASRGATDMLLGPTWGKIENLRQATSSAFGKDWSAADTSAVRRLIPMQNLVWLRGAFNQIEGATNSYFNVPEKKAPH